MLLVHKFHQISSEAPHDEPSQERHQERNNREVAILIVDDGKASAAVLLLQEAFQTLLPAAKRSYPVDGDNQLFHNYPPLFLTVNSILMSRPSSPKDSSAFLK